MFSLRNFFKEAVAQVNPFDGGQTAATVRANRGPTPPPAQTPKPKGQGGSLFNPSGFGQPAQMPQTPDFAKITAPPQQPVPEESQQKQPSLVDKLKSAPENLIKQTFGQVPQTPRDVVRNLPTAVMRAGSPTSNPFMNPAAALETLGYNQKKVDVTGSLETAQNKFQDTSIGKNKVVDYVNDNLVNPTLKSVARVADVKTGQENYDQGLKGVGQVATDAFNLGSLVYAPVKAGVLAKGGVPALKAAPGALVRGAGAGAGINVLNQLGEGVAPEDVSLKDAALTGAISGVANVGMPLISGAAGRVAKKAAPVVGEVASKTKTAITNATNDDLLGRAQSRIVSLGESGHAQIPGRQSQPETPEPKGFIVAESKPRAGRVDTVRVTRDPSTGELVRTQQTEFTPETKQFARTFGVSEEEAARTLSAPPSKQHRNLDKIIHSGKNAVDDTLDKQKYGINDVKETPEATLDDVYRKHLDIDTLTEEQLNQGSRTGLRSVRDTVRKTNVLRGANTLVDRGLEKMSRGNAITRRINRAAQYINKEAGQDPVMLEAARKYGGEGTFNDASLVQLGKKTYDLVPDDASRARVHAVLDPESADGKITFADLSDSEKQAAGILRDIGDAINDTSYRAGMISKKKWESNRGGRYIARLYKEVATADDVADLLDLPDARGLHLGMYKSRVDLNDALKQKLIRDPVKLAVIRGRQIAQNEALFDYMATAETRGYVSNTPKPGFIKVNSQNRMANWAGRYVRQDVYENIEGFKAMGKAMNAINNMLDVYDGSMPRRVRKKMLTIYNPVVRAGNVTSNYFFAYLNGVNPVTFQKNKIWASKALKGNDPLKVAAQRAGLIGNDIIGTDRNLFKHDKFTKDADIAGGKGVRNTIKKGIGRLEQRYGEADDIAKLSAFKSHVDRGHSINDAIEMTRRGFQDYSRVGHLYDMAAKAPVFGNAFIRFQGDLYTNILKNAAVDHPMRLGAMIGGIAALGEGLSRLSGETPEDKKTREDRLGAPKIPFTNISTEFQTPWGAVDASRFGPLYMRNILSDSAGGNKFADDLSRMLPFNIPGKNTKEEWARAASSDPLIGGLIQQAADVDWKGKSITDPDGVRDGKQLFPDDPLSGADKLRNRFQYGLRTYLPYPFNEVGDIAASINQDKRNEQAADGSKYDPSQPNVDFWGRTGYNTSGSKKSVAQSLARMFGVRMQEYNAEDAAKAREDQKMFAFFDQADAFKKSLDSSTRQQFEARHNSSNTRDGIKEEFAKDPWYKYKNASELLQNPALFDAEKQYAVMQNQYDGRPIDPIFYLPKDQRNMVLAKKLKLPGSKDEGFNTLYDQEWYQNFRQQQDAYYGAKSEYAKSKGWGDYESDNPYPEASANVQDAINAYLKLPSGTGQRSAFIRNNPDVWKSITDQWAKQDAWTDKERAALGLPAIPREDNAAKNNSYGRGGGKRGNGIATANLSSIFKQGMTGANTKRSEVKVKAVKAKKVAKKTKTTKTKSGFKKGQKLA